MSGAEERAKIVKSAVERFEYAVERAAEPWEPDGSLDQPGARETKRIWTAEVDKRRAELLKLVLEAAA